MAKKYFRNYKLELAAKFIFEKLLNQKENLDIHSVLDLASGDNLPKSKMELGDVPVYGGGGLTDNSHSKWNVTFSTIGIGRVGARCGCVFKIPSNSWVTDNALFAKKISNDFDHDFLIHFLNYKGLNQFANNSLQPVISKKRISGVKIPKIDLGIQIELGELFDSILKNQIRDDLAKKYQVNQILNFEKEWKNSKVLLENQLTDLHSLRQAILQEAIQGKLVPQDANDEPAEKLLERIRAEKKRLIAEKKIKKEKPLPPIEAEEIPFELPKGWIWCRLGELTELITKGSSPKWQGINYVENQAEGIFFVTSKNVGNNEIILKNKQYVEKRFNEIEPRSVLKRGDLLTNIVGASIGRTAIYDLDENANINQAVCIIRLLHNLTSKYFILNFFNSPFCIKLMFDKQFAPGRANLSMGDISKFSIPLPPLAEQKRIVSKVESLLGLVSELEAQVEAQQSDVGRLMQGVLQEAFG